MGWVVGSALIFNEVQDVSAECWMLLWVIKYSYVNKDS